MLSINEFHILKIFIDVIKNQALSSENEIYGWLIGYQKDDIPHVLAIIECKKFEQQTLISAIPDVQVFQEISSVMPQGIGPIGIYHSHPFSSEIFHSHTDDSTLISLSNQFPNCVSIVTNGQDINYYQMGKNSEANEIKVKFIEPEIPKFLLFSLDENLLIKINKSVLNNMEDISSLKIKILNEISDYLDNAWSNVEFFIKSSKISENKLISRYLVNKLAAKPIQIKISAKKNTNNTAQLIINNNNESQGKTEPIGIDYESLKLDLKAKVPIYINAEDKNFGDLNQIIKTEVISNNLLQKVYNCVIDFENRKVITPDDCYLSFFGFFIRILCFNKKNLNENNLYWKNFEFISKIVSQFNSFTNIELSDKIINQIQTFLKDVKKISKKFTWYQEIKNNLKLLNKNLILIKKD